jgi:hypothetical protein
VLKTEDDIRRLERGRLLITGSQGVVYQIRDLLALDRARAACSNAFSEPARLFRFGFLRHAQTALVLFSGGRTPPPAWRTRWRAMSAWRPWALTTGSATSSCRRG